MKNIHIVCKSEKKNPPRPVVPKSNHYRSTSWSISDKLAAAIVGGKVFFHQGQKEPSYFGGVVTRCEPCDEDRYAIYFDYDPDCTDVKPTCKWSYEIGTEEV